VAVRPDISVLIPARNEGTRIAPTIRAIARARTTDARVEFVVVDDASTDGSVALLLSSVPRLLNEPRIDISLLQLEEHSGNYRTRNHAAAVASADILFITDAHVQFSRGWDEGVLRTVQPDRILAATVTQQDTPFRGYGARLIVPLMGTSWNHDAGDGPTAVPIAVCSATVLPRDLFRRLGGYDNQMIQYGGGEPEFCVRAWLEGASVVSVPDLEVQHEFKPREEFSRFLEGVRLYWVHNCIRFGLLYLSELGCMQLLRFYARAFPSVFQRALALVEKSDVWQRRAELEGRRQRSFPWFVDYFGLRNQIGGEIL
jgi:glycosyltransferase involved in cell wall biosynthesis